MECFDNFSNDIHTQAQCSISLFFVINLTWFV